MAGSATTAAVKPAGAFRHTFNIGHYALEGLTWVGAISRHPISPPIEAVRPDSSPRAAFCDQDGAALIATGSNRRTRENRVVGATLKRSRLPCPTGQALGYRTIEPPAGTSPHGGQPQTSDGRRRSKRAADQAPPGPPPFPYRQADSCKCGGRAARQEAAANAFHRLQPGAVLWAPAVRLDGARGCRGSRADHLRPRQRVRRGPLLRALDGRAARRVRHARQDCPCRPQRPAGRPGGRGGRASHGGERRDRVQQLLVLHRYEVENSIDMFATVHLKFAAEICAGGGGVGVRRHDGERRRRGCLRQPSVRQRHMTTLTCRYRSTAQVLASGNGAVRASSPTKE